MSTLTTAAVVVIVNCVSSNRGIVSRQLYMNCMGIYFLINRFQHRLYESYFDGFLTKFLTDCFMDFLTGNIIERIESKMTSLYHHDHHLHDFYNCINAMAKCLFEWHDAIQSFSKLGLHLNVHSLSGYIDQKLFHLTAYH